MDTCFRILQARWTIWETDLCIEDAEEVDELEALHYPGLLAELLRALLHQRLPLARDRLRVVAYEDVVGDGADAVLADLVAFVGARDTAAKLTTDLVRNGNGTDGFFADDAAAAAALRAAGCPEVAPRLLPDGDQREP